MSLGPTTSFSLFSDSFLIILPRFHLFPLSLNYSSSLLFLLLLIHFFVFNYSSLILVGKKLLASSSHGSQD
ncbi:hypothetical protein RchiOBHm_Chr6g0296381 [Rosa chinensis]|uniref:Uncharacterized protein n=1 Tax=Rosa chinensis TaxID=74649 RepID=A0A2P6PXF7_ROSCH|nr:hypothetical protein RchiOBHm_Chr6g0296381 [Rosa chinensis]